LELTSQSTVLPEKPIVKILITYPHLLGTKEHDHFHKNLTLDLSCATWIHSTCYTFLPGDSFQYYASIYAEVSCMISSLQS